MSEERELYEIRYLMECAIPILDRIAVALEKLAPQGSEREQVARLSVAVVHDRIEEGNRSERFVGGVDEVDRPLHPLVFNPELGAAKIGRAITQDCWRNNGEPKRFREEIGGNLASRKCAGREVPERRFAADRFVDYV